MTAVTVATQGLVEESTKILEAIAAGNGKTLPIEELSLLEAPSLQATTLLDTFRVKKLRGRMMILMLSWFVASMAYYGVSLALDDLPGSLYLNFFLTSVVELPCYLACIAVRSFLMLLGSVLLQLSGNLVHISNVFTFQMCSKIV
jgi:hypothetical protein